MNMGEIADTIEKNVNREVLLRYAAAALISTNWIRFRCAFNSEKRTLTMQWSPNTAVNPITGYRVHFSQTPDIDNFFEMVNVPINDRASYCPFGPPVAGFTQPVIVFNNVWNRKPDDLYFHASFVNHTQFNYLGIHGDFYTKPSKIYAADNLPMDFYFWMSVDIMRPIVLPFERFIIELAFIIDSKEYQSP
jgi:hypothetical protein